MREPERDFGRLQDIIQAANNILSFTEGHTQEQIEAIMSGGNSKP